MHKKAHTSGGRLHPKPCIRFLWGFGMRIFFEFYSWWIGFDEWELPFSSHRLFEKKDGHEIRQSTVFGILFDSLWVPKLDKIPLKLLIRSASCPRVEPWKACRLLDDITGVSQQNYINSQSKLLAKYDYNCGCWLQPIDLILIETFVSNIILPPRKP